MSRLNPMSFIVAYMADRFNILDFENSSMKDQMAEHKGMGRVEDRAI